MMVSFNYRDKLKAAYQRGASDMLLHLKMEKHPKPDVEKYLAELDKQPTVARF